MDQCWQSDARDLEEKYMYDANTLDYYIIVGDASQPGYG